MKEIESVCKNFKSIIDDDDYEIASKIRWSALKVKTGKIYFVSKVKGKFTYLHRVIAKATKGQEVDHRNRETLDNRKHNLRICDRSGNCKNILKRKGLSSQYLGVSYHKRDRCWRASIRTKIGRLHLGNFKTEREAAIAYDFAATKYHGEFANLNQVK